jgi:predicted thioesterase
MSDLDLSNLKPGLTATLSAVVTSEVTARHVGSGSLEVFATPIMIALMEKAAVDSIASALPAGTTTLGTAVHVSHEAPSGVGTTIFATAELRRVEDRTLTFRVEARDSAGLIGRGEHTRAVVVVERFLDKVRRRAGVAG